MAFNDRAVARQLDFGDEGVRQGRRIGPDSRRGLRLAVRSAVLRGPDKYKVLEHRRRQAQIQARRAVDAAAVLDFEC
jgi:hypothetical protein